MRPPRERAQVRRRGAWRTPAPRRVRAEGPPARSTGGTAKKALVYHGPENVSVDEVPDARVEKATDVLVRITTTNICGSDLHMDEGRSSVEVGDRVVLPFDIGCGFCKNCEGGYTGFCLTAHPGNAGATYGYADMGPHSGGQAELLRVPWADWNCLVLTEDAQATEGSRRSATRPTTTPAPSSPG